MLVLQLALVLAVAALYRLELERGIGVVAAILLPGFLVHALLPLRFRLPVFLALTLVAIGILLRLAGLWLLIVGLCLLCLCHLPLKWWTRLALVLTAGIGLAALRVSRIDAVWSETVFPVLAGMFMFRLSLYLYDLKHNRSPASFSQRLAYFFLLPNVSFPLFPVIDYKTFLHTYYDDEAYAIYQKGIYWMSMGVLHLLAYRFLYYLMPRVDDELNGVMSVFAFMTMTYGLYLRVSGLFHLIMGTLCVFGFNLPRTNRYYFLASSFNDLWRRINIYWKDFMMTIVFYPMFQGLRRLSMGVRISLATAVVFIVTWALHSYQWFWLQGSFPIAATDIVFWGVLACALIANSLWEIRHPRRSLLPDDWSWKRALVRTLQTAGVFFTMSALWSLWSSDSLANWWYLLRRVEGSRPMDWLLLGGTLAIIILGGTIAQWVLARPRISAVAGWLNGRYQKAVPALSCALLLFILPMGRSRPESVTSRLVDKLQSTELNRFDRERQERGYYEVLTRSNRLGVAWSSPESPEVPFLRSEAVRRTADIRGVELVPDYEGMEWNAPFRANRWGMRDRDYTREKAEGTYRIALLGSSQVMGQGVGNDETFENLVEERLNRELSPLSGIRYEILNFAVAGYAVPQAVYAAERIVPQFEPDAVIYVVHPFESSRLANRLSTNLTQFGARIGEDFDYIDEVLDDADAHPGLPTEEFVRRLRPYTRDLVRASYRRMAGAVRDHGSVPVLVFLRLTESEFDPDELTELMRVGNESGFLVISLDGLYAGHRLEQIRYDRTDNHPNALGHRLIADRLYSSILENTEQLRLPTAPRR